MKVVDPYRFGGGSAPFGGECWELDGLNEYISVPDDSSLSFGDATTDSPFSIVYWAKMVDATGYFAINKFASLTNCEYFFGVNTSNQFVCEICDLQYANRLTIFSTTATIYEGSWHMFTFTYDGSGSNLGMALFVDNVLVAAPTRTSSGSYTAMHNTTSAFTIGNLIGNYAEGRQADIWVFDIQLLAANVTAVYNGGAPRNEAAESLSANVVSGWTAADGGINPTDIGGNNTNDGTGVNMDASNIIVDYPS